MPSTFISVICFRKEGMGAIHSTKIPTGPTGRSGPPQKVDPFFRNFSGWTELIHWVLDRNFRKFWLNGSRPMIQCSYRSHAKKPESGHFSDWIGINTDDLRCSDWPKCGHPLVVVDFSLHFFLASWAVNTHASSLWNFCRLSSLEFEECLNRISSVEIFSISS